MDTTVSDAARPRPPDPAERGLLRWYYRDWRPTPFGRFWSGLWAKAAATGLLPRVLLTLQTTDRATGRRRSTVLAVLHDHRERYLVSMLGDGSEWVKNVRAAKGQAWVKRGRTKPVRLVELPVEERAPVLKAWCRIATSGRRHLPVRPDAPEAEFAAIAADYPVFRIDPRAPRPRASPETAAQPD